jgi:hypothetical protein
MEKRRKREEKMNERMMRKQEKKEIKEAEDRGDVPRRDSLENAPTALEYLAGPLEADDDEGDDDGKDSRPRR